MRPGPARQLRVALVLPLIVIVSVGCHPASPAVATPLAPITPLPTRTPPTEDVTPSGESTADVISSGTPFVIELPEVTPQADFTATGELHWPLAETGQLRQIFWSQHTGIDLVASPGASALAADNGVVLLAEFTEVYGNLVIIDHGNGYQTWYGHLDSFDVTPLEGVRQGEPVGVIGNTGVSTGPHLHFEVRLNGRPVIPFRHLADTPQDILELGVAFERRTSTAIARATQTELAFRLGQTATAERAIVLTRVAEETIAALVMTNAYLSRMPTRSATPSQTPTATLAVTATATATVTETVEASATSSPTIDPSAPTPTASGTATGTEGAGE